jgi:hypothetical protein
VLTELVDLGNRACTIHSSLKAWQRFVEHHLKGFWLQVTSLKSLLDFTGNSKKRQSLLKCLSLSLSLSLSVKMARMVKDKPMLRQRPPCLATNSIVTIAPGSPLPVNVEAHYCNTVRQVWQESRGDSRSQIWSSLLVSGRPLHRESGHVNDTLRSTRLSRECLSKVTARNY